LIIKNGLDNGCKKIPPFGANKGIEEEKNTPDRGCFLVKMVNIKLG
jgi:hypothetical protein